MELNPTQSTKDFSCNFPFRGFDVATGDIIRNFLARKSRLRRGKFNRNPTQSAIDQH